MNEARQARKMQKALKNAFGEYGLQIGLDLLRLGRATLTDSEDSFYLPQEYKEIVSGIYRLKAEGKSEELKEVSQRLGSVIEGLEALEAQRREKEQPRQTSCISLDDYLAEKVQKPHIPQIRARVISAMEQEDSPLTKNGKWIYGGRVIRYNDVKEVRYELDDIIVASGFNAGTIPIAKYNKETSGKILSKFIKKLGVKDYDEAYRKLVDTIEGRNDALCNCVMRTRASGFYVTNGREAEAEGEIRRILGEEAFRQPSKREPKKIAVPKKTSSGVERERCLPIEQILANEHLSGLGLAKARKAIYDQTDANPVLSSNYLGGRGGKKLYTNEPAVREEIVKIAREATAPKKRDYQHTKKEKLETLDLDSYLETKVQIPKIEQIKNRINAARADGNENLVKGSKEVYHGKVIRYPKSESVLNEIDDIIASSGFTIGSFSFANVEDTQAKIPLSKVLKRMHVVDLSEAQSKLTATLYGRSDELCTFVTKKGKGFSIVAGQEAVAEIAIKRLLGEEAFYQPAQKKERGDSQILKIPRERCLSIEQILEEEHLGAPRFARARKEVYSQTDENPILKEKYISGKGGKKDYLDSPEIIAEVLRIARSVTAPKPKGPKGLGGNTNRRNNNFRTDSTTLRQMVGKDTNLYQTIKEIISRGERGSVELFEPYGEGFIARNGKYVEAQKFVDEVYQDIKTSSRKSMPISTTNKKTEIPLLDFSDYFHISSEDLRFGQFKRMLSIIRGSGREHLLLRDSFSENGAIVYRDTPEVRTIVNRLGEKYGLKPGTSEVNPIREEVRQDPTIREEAAKVPKNNGYTIVNREEIAKLRKQMPNSPTHMTLTQMADKLHIPVPFVQYPDNRRLLGRPEDTVYGMGSFRNSSVALVLDKWLGAEGKDYRANHPLQGSEKKEEKKDERWLPLSDIAEEAGVKLKTVMRYAGRFGKSKRERTSGGTIEVYSAETALRILENLQESGAITARDIDQ